MQQVRPNPVMSSFLADCTPGYYNNEGQFDGRQFPLGGGYHEGAPAYFRYIDRWRTSGDFAGLAFSRTLLSVNCPVFLRELERIRDLALSRGNMGRYL